MLFKILKPLLFLYDPEKIHNISIRYFKNYPELLSSRFRVQAKDLTPVKSKNLNWKNSVGLAAGFDKNAEALEFLDKLGFGAIEVGTVTPEAQVGNEKPRIFRLKKEKSLRNSMGFPSKGAHFVLDRVKNYDGVASLGINIGKNKETPLSEAYKDYLHLYEMFKDYADYLVINVSSPNTPGLRELQRSDHLELILKSISEVRKDSDPALLLKISPDEGQDKLSEIVDMCLKYKLSGIVATNTTRVERLGAGGVSGELLKEKSWEVLSYLLKVTKDLKDFDIIGVGGFSSTDDVKKFYEAGGRFFQIYTSFIYQGPEIIKKLSSNIN